MLCLAGLMTAMPLISSLGEEQAALLPDRHLPSKGLAEQVVVMQQDWGDSVL